MRRVIMLFPAVRRAGTTDRFNASRLFSARPVARSVQHTYTLERYRLHDPIIISRMSQRFAAVVARNAPATANGTRMLSTSFMGKDSTAAPTVDAMSNGSAYSIAGIALHPQR